MSSAAAHDHEQDTAYAERVRCLDCGATYMKPSRGSISETNPGCPRCEYVGWVPFTAPAPVRSVAGRRLHPSR